VSQGNKGDCGKEPIVGNKGDKKPAGTPRRPIGGGRGNRGLGRGMRFTLGRSRDVE